MKNITPLTLTGLLLFSGAGFVFPGAIVQASNFTDSAHSPRFFTAQFNFQAPDLQNIVPKNLEESQINFIPPELTEPMALPQTPQATELVNRLQNVINDISDLIGELFKKSGHWEYFKNNMFNFKVEREEYSIKPMNCPESTVIFASKTSSYKDLPLRLSEFGRLHRNERSGTLNGMFRVRQFVMDDAHVFCRPDQIQSEIAQMLDITLELYQKLQLPVAFGLATRPEKAMGSKESWNKAEQQLADALKSHKIDYKILKGEGTFYGPKIHIDFKDFLNRLWTILSSKCLVGISGSLKEQMKESGQA